MQFTRRGLRGRAEARGTTSLDGRPAARFVRRLGCGPVSARFYWDREVCSSGGSPVMAGSAP